MTSISLVTNGDTPLDEQYVQDAFHTFLQASPAHLLDVEVLSSAEGDLMIKGVSLPFVLLIVLNRTRARAVPLLGSTALHDQPPLDSSPSRRRRCEVRPALSRTNCPSTFVPLMNCWSEGVPTIQVLAPKRRHELLRLICGLGPPTSPSGVTSSQRNSAP